MCGVCVCVCVLDGEGTWVYNSVSTALVVVNIALCLIGYSDYVTSFCDPFLPPYRCHVGLKNV